MTREEAIRILDPETTAEALEEIEYYAGFRGKEAVTKAVDDACILAVAALREQEQRRWIPVDAVETVDAVEVVRCLDCRHWLQDVGACTDFVGRCELANYMVGAVGYCIYGERKDGYD